MPEQQYENGTSENHSSMKKGAICQTKPNWKYEKNRGLCVCRGLGSVNYGFILKKKQIRRKKGISGKIRSREYRRRRREKRTIS